MANADIACHIAKNKGRNQVHVYTPDSDQRASMDIELNWSARIEDALRDNLFVLQFQPVLQLSQIDLSDLPQTDGELWMRHLASPRLRRVHYEALLRMRTATGDLVAPEAFLPTAERYNLMLDIDRWVINAALCEVREQQLRHPQCPMGVSINLSAQSLGANGIGRYVMDKLVEFNVDPSLVTFEITETKAVTNLDAARELINQLRGLGCRFALDDFGCGFSSFTHLKHLDVDFLKIDGSFIQGLLDDPVDRAVITAINNIAHSVGKRTVAEYVDRPEVLAALHACGVDYVQGYYIGRPVSDLAAACLQARARVGQPAAPTAAVR
jgi:EAL domain-containing protein (putative c-di-GMP-specific phosphodiesterase class I)